MEVGAGGEALAAHAGDELTGLHNLADGDVEGLHVAVNGDGAVLVADTDPVAEALRRAGVDHGASGNCADRGARGVGDVDAVVHRAPAHTKARGEGTLGRLSKQRRAGGFVQAGNLVGVLDSLVQLLGEVLHRLVFGDGEDLRGLLGGSLVHSRIGALELVGVCGELDVLSLLGILVAGEGTGDQAGETSGGHSASGCCDDGNAPLVGGLLAVLAALLLGVEHEPSLRSSVGHLLRCSQRNRDLPVIYERLL